MKEAMFYNKLDKNLGNVQCQLCSHRCTIKKGDYGICGVRKNNNGVLESLVFGKAISASLDPIEKKPLFHFRPGSKALSLATVGCNFKCAFCQNFNISQVRDNDTDEIDIRGEWLPPEELARMVEKADGFSWTYTEPTVFFEYFYETALAVEKAGIKGKYHTWVTNGYTSEDAIKEAAKYVNAVNIDYKGDSDFYRKICKAKLEHVQNSMRVWKEQGVWIELTNLLIPGKNDYGVGEMCKWVAENLGEDTPLHISAYHPAHKMKNPATSIDDLENAHKIASSFLKFVYLGNVRSEHEHTYCPECKEIVIERHGYGMTEVKMKKAGNDWKCKKCGAGIAMGDKK